MISLPKTKRKKQKKKTKEDDQSSGALRRWRNLQRSEDDRTATGQMVGGLAEKDLCRKGPEGPGEQQAGGLHHRMVTNRAREVTLVLHSALMGSHEKHSVLFWDPPVTANTLRNWRGCSGETLRWEEGQSMGCVRNGWGAAHLQPGEEKAKEVTAVTNNPGGRGE